MREFLEAFPSYLIDNMHKASRRFLQSFVSPPNPRSDIWQRPAIEETILRPRACDFSRLPNPSAAQKSWDWKPKDFQWINPPRAEAQRCYRTGPEGRRRHPGATGKQTDYWCPMMEHRTRGCRDV
jgi:hypothetical protein